MRVGECVALALAVAVRDRVGDAAEWLPDEHVSVPVAVSMTLPELLSERVAVRELLGESTAEAVGVRL